jgi:hypothetical protein
VPVCQLNTEVYEIVPRSQKECALRRAIIAAIRRTIAIQGRFTMLDPRYDDTVRHAIAGVAKSYGVDPTQMQRAAIPVIESLSGAMARMGASRGGLADLVEILGAPGREAYLQPDARLKSPEVENDGIGILSQILGSRDKSRAVAARAAKASGLSDAMMKAVLPSLAAVVTGAMSKQTHAAFGDILKIPGLDEIAREARDDMGGGGQLAPPQYDSPLPLPGEPPRRYSPTPRDGWSASTGRDHQNPPIEQPPAAPAPRTSGGVREQRPLPVPGDDVPGMGRHQDNPYGDLTDILRRGGFRLPGGFRIPGGQPGGTARPSANPRPSGLPDAESADAGGGLLSNIIRNILGSVLGGGRAGGSGSGGIVSWVIRLILLRYGSKILRGILRRFGLNI